MYKDDCTQTFDDKQQQKMESKMSKQVKNIKKFLDIGKVKTKPIHIYLKDSKKEPVVQKLLPVAFQPIEPLRLYLNKLFNLMEDNLYRENRN